MNSGALSKIRYILKGVGVLGAVFMMSTSVFALDFKGFTLTENGQYYYDANEDGPKTKAQEAVDYMYSIGARHVVLEPYARMKKIDSSKVEPITPSNERDEEMQRYVRLMQYIHSKNMTVAIRPTIFVDRVNTNDDLWHGNIRPKKVNDWFRSLRTYLSIYSAIATAGDAEEFTVGAELYSMTVGNEDQWPEQPYGFPAQWLSIIESIREELPAKTKIMYDINYTDYAKSSDVGKSGGELERWRYRLVDLKPKEGESLNTKGAKDWEVMKNLWLSLDYVGLDCYRSLAKEGDEIPEKYSDLVEFLQEKTDEFADDIDTKLRAISVAVGASKQVIFKESGFKSCRNCFIDPYKYADDRPVYIPHQAAAYEAFFNSFVKKPWKWMAGVAFWDIATEGRSGPTDPGFSPRGKTQTEDIIRQNW